MTDLEHIDENLCFANFSEDTIIANAIPPLTFSISLERLPMRSRIRTTFEIFSNPPGNECADMWI